MENIANPDLNWSIRKKIAFRFVFIFFLLFIIIKNNGAYPFWYAIMKYPQELLHKIIPWIGKHILQLSYDITVFTNGSGDTTYDYVIVFTIAVLAIIGAGLWSVLDRRRTDYNKLYYWLTVAIRFYVGLMLIHYGLIKVIKLQFSSPGPYRLLQNYGDSSPMGLAWTFLGFSKGYNLFMGIAEVAAVLLLFRRTMTAGAIITLMTTANVMAVNYFYDVPVKILSTALFVMALFLLLNDGGRLLKFFFTGRPIALPVIKAPAIHQRWLRIAKLSVKSLIMGYVLIYGTINALRSQKQYGENAPKPKFYGIYDIDLFIKNNDTIPPLLTDTIRWKQVIVQWQGFVHVRYMKDSVARFSIKLDTVAQKIDFTPRNDTIVKYSFRYELPESNKFHLTGTMEEDAVSVFMTKKDLKDFRLINRGFNWINEYPFNR